jgi:hypothetical protein
MSDDRVVVDGLPWPVVVGKVIEPSPVIKRPRGVQRARTERRRRVRSQRVAETDES